MYKTILIILFLMVSCLLQHISHELLHIFVGKKMGLSINKIQWFTYHGGTKVFFAWSRIFKTFHMGTGYDFFVN